MPARWSSGSGRNTGRCILRLLASSSHLPCRSPTSRSPRRRVPRFLPHWASGREWPPYGPRFFTSAPDREPEAASDAIRPLELKGCRDPPFAGPMPGICPGTLFSEPTGPPLYWEETQDVTSPDMESRLSRGKCQRYSPPVFGPARGARSAPSGVAQRAPRATGRGQKVLRRPGPCAVRRLRRRITLICAGCPGGQSRMTVLRRELPPSIRANPPGRGPSVARGRRGLSNRACTVRGSWAASGWDDMHAPTSFQLRRQGDRVRVC